jgi:hypothetical protein
VWEFGRKQPEKITLAGERGPRTVLEFEPLQDNTESLQDNTESLQDNTSHCASASSWRLRQIQVSQPYLHPFLDISDGIPPID